MDQLLVLEFVGWVLIVIDLFGAKDRINSCLNPVHQLLFVPISRLGSAFLDRPREIISAVIAFSVSIPLIFGIGGPDPLGLAFFTPPEPLVEAMQSDFDNVRKKFVIVGMLVFLVFVLPALVLISLFLLLARVHPSGIIGTLGVIIALSSSILSRV